MNKIIFTSAIYMPTFGYSGEKDESVIIRIEKSTHLIYNILDEPL